MYVGLFQGIDSPSCEDWQVRDVQPERLKVSQAGADVAVTRHQSVLPWEMYFCS